MTDHIEALKSLRTSLIDSRNGYQEALEDAEGKGLTPLFRDMIALRSKDIDGLTPFLIAYGEDAGQEGSFMSSVHRTVIGIRSILTGLDESILPGLIDGENRILGYYESAIELTENGSSEYITLIKQRDTLQFKISEMQARKDKAA